MDWNARFGWILLVAFGLGALHALEPGHGKSIMGAYLVAARGGARHAVLLGIVVTLTHTIVVFHLALGALYLAQGLALERVTFWLELASASLVLAVGLWLILGSFGILRCRAGAHEELHRHPHPHPHRHTHRHPNSHDAHASHHGHSDAARVPEGTNPLGVWTLIGVGASGGLVPCPAALTALLAAVNLGRVAEGIAVVGAMSLGIASTLIAVGIVFVQANRFAIRLFGERSLVAYVPRVSAVVITGLGIGLLVRALAGAGH
jgi:ABC-type nickel/cobalt efflux system permease component RcnA